MLVEDVEAAGALDVGQGELGAVAVPITACKDAAEDKNAKPGEDDLAPVAETPRPRRANTEDSFREVRDATRGRVMAQPVRLTQNRTKQMLSAGPDECGVSN